MGLFEDLKGQIRRVMLGQGANFSQRRRHSRIVCAIPVVLSTGKISSRGKVLDLSLEGARVELGGDKAPFKVGQNLQMSLAQASLGEREGEAEARVRWVRKGLRGWETGLSLPESGRHSWVPRLLSQCGLAREAFHTRRIQARKALQARARVTLGSSQVFAVDLVDLSMGGAAVVSSKALARFLPVRLELTLAGKLTALSAQVAHVRLYSEPKGQQQERLWLCGLRFDHLERAEADLLGRHLVKA